MDDTFRKHLTNCVLNDSDVLFQWCMAGQGESDEDAQDCLEKIVEKWITISRVRNMKNRPSRINLPIYLTY